MSNLQSRLEALESYLFCRLTASLSKLLRTGSAGPTSTTSTSTRADESASAVIAEEDDKQSTEENIDSESVSTTFDAVEEKVIENLSPSWREKPDTNGAQQDEDRVREEEHKLLDLVLERAATKMADFSGEQIRRILLHVVLLPFQADEFVDAAEAEVNNRLLALDADAATSRFGSLQELSEYAADATVDIAATLSASSLNNGDHPFKFLRKGGKDRELASESLSDLAAEANRAAASACEAAARLDRVNRGAHLKGEEILQQIEQGAAFELGRCQILIERYRRIAFMADSFSRRSRYDDERRKNIGKRVCSRLFS